MKLTELRLFDDALVVEEDCLGAVFCSYTFDPAYFEEHVLRSVLRLRGDPSEDALAYHEEARAALQNAPVACLIDASVRKSGHRLPYDLKLIRQRTFHPKTFLLLYESEARLAIGSGNLASGLFGGTAVGARAATPMRAADRACAPRQRARTRVRWGRARMVSALVRAVAGRT